MNKIDGELFEAALYNNLPEIRRLVSAGADVNTTDNGAGTPLHWASNRGYVQTVIELLGLGADIDAKDNTGWTPLHWACFNGRLPVVNELQEQGADIEAKNQDGDTPLHNASVGGYLPIVKALVSGGADTLAANNDGELPMHCAVMCRKSEVSKYLLQNFYATTRRLPLHELVDDLTWIGDPNSTITGVPPLRAALHRNVLGMDDVVEILEYLIDQNPALVSSRDKAGSLPLHVACRRGASFTVVQSLINRYKASVKSMTPQGDLPLFLACEMPGTSLDTTFLLMRQNPTCDVVYDSV
jgi:ankyrin repeat protein